MDDDGEAALGREIMETLAELERLAPRPGPRPKGSQRSRGLSAQERQARKRLRKRRDAMVDAFKQAGRRSPAGGDGPLRGFPRSAGRSPGRA
jgi:hypothetical protein